MKDTADFYRSCCFSNLPLPRHPETQHLQGHFSHLVEFLLFFLNLVFVGKCREIYLLDLAEGGYLFVVIPVAPLILLAQKGHLGHYFHLQLNLADMDT